VVRGAVVSLSMIHKGSSAHRAGSIPPRARRALRAERAARDEEVAAARASLEQMRDSMAARAREVARKVRRGCLYPASRGAAVLPLNKKPSLPLSPPKC